jgi:hypothetical protein
MLVPFSKKGPANRAPQEKAEFLEKTTKQTAHLPRNIVDRKRIESFVAFVIFCKISLCLSSSFAPVLLWLHEDDSLFW